MLKYFIVVFVSYFTFQSCYCYAQDAPKINISKAKDCSTAMSIIPEDTFGPTTAPHGYGNVLEFSNNPKSSLHHFEAEHNSVWYKFMIPFEGYLVFDILPLCPKDDYDFLLFRYVNGKTFCNDIIEKKTYPVRSNIGRNDVSIGGKTGLNLSSTNAFKDSGPGNSYSSAIQVKKGEIYYLVLDNVYENGSGHSLVFNYLNKDSTSAVKREIKGIILDQNTQKNLAADVVLEDAVTGEILGTTKTDPASGEFVFIMPAEFDMNKTYIISVNANGYFFSDYEIVPAKEKGKKKAYSVSSLEKGKSYTIKNIYFYPNSPQFIPSSVVVIRKLLSLLEDNPAMEIEIAGHIDGCGSDPEMIRKLSEARAANVKRYLTDRGITEKRIGTLGYGCSKMLYPNPANEEERQMNRRVEVRIIKY